MSPLNRGPLLGPRVPPVGIRPPLPPRFAGRLPPPGLHPRMPLPPINPVFGPMRQRLPPPPRPAGVLRPAGPMPLFGPRGRGMAPIVPPMGLRGTGPRGPPIRPWHRRALPPQIMSHMRPRFSIGNGNVKGKSLNNVKKVNKLEELELKKPWMTDDIRSEIQKKNKLYAKAKKNKDAKEWEEFKDLRNKVTRMIRDAKNDYLAKHPEQGGQKTDDKSTNESEGVQKTENAPEQSEQKEQTEETQPSSEQAQLYPVEEEPYDQRDENHIGSDDDESYYCEVCDRDFTSEDSLSEHKKEHKLCGIDGCTFSAHPLLVERHINMQHSSGLYERIKNLSTPEDIDKWIMERKKKYPTKVNIESRKAEELEKMQRGEIIKQNQNVVNSQKKKLSNSRERKRRGQKRNNKVLKEIVHEAKETYRGLQTFSGTMRLVEINTIQEIVTRENIKETIDADSITHISDEEDLLVGSVSSPITKTGLLSLVANYGSDSEGSDAPEEVPFKKVKAADDDVDNDTEKATNENKTLDKVNESTQESLKKQAVVPVSSVNSHCIKKHKTLTELRQNLKEKDHRNVRSKRPERLRLLNKLLARSIQHERNLICQCIKYILDNNFFD